MLVLGGITQAIASVEDIDTVQAPVSPVVEAVEAVEAPPAPDRVLTEKKTRFANQKSSKTS